MEILIGIAKSKKHSAPGQGDGLEIIERPTGGMTAILADGYGGGHSLSGISTKAVLKAAQFIADGVRDNVVARSVHDCFCAEQDGNFSIAFTMVSADTESQSLVLCRNTVCPTFVRHEFGVDVYDEPAQALGAHKNPRSLVIRRPLEEGMLVATFSDGVLNAGRKHGRALDINTVVRLLEESNPEDAHYLAQSILERALTLDSFQALDHMSVVVMGVGSDTSTYKVEYRTSRYMV